MNSYMYLKWLHPPLCLCTEMNSLVTKRIYNMGMYVKISLCAFELGNNTVNTFKVYFVYKNKREERCTPEENLLKYLPDKLYQQCGSYINL